MLIFSYLIFILSFMLRGSVQIFFLYHLSVTMLMAMFFLVDNFLVKC